MWSHDFYLSFSSSRSILSLGHSSSLVLASPTPPDKPWWLVFSPDAQGTPERTFRNVSRLRPLRSQSPIRSQRGSGFVISCQSWTHTPLWERWFSPSDSARSWTSRSPSISCPTATMTLWRRSSASPTCPVTSTRSTRDSSRRSGPRSFDYRKRWDYH